MSATPDTHPLQPQHRAACNDIIASCGVTGRLIERMRKVGLPVDDLHAANQAHLDLARAIKAEWWPTDV